MRPASIPCPPRASLQNVRACKCFIYFFTSYLSEVSQLAQEAQGGRGIYLYVALDELVTNQQLLPVSHRVQGAVCCPGLSRHRAAFWWQLA